MLIIETSSKATKEVKKIIDWYEDKSEGLGERFLKEMNREIKRIASKPHVYMHISPTVQRANLKKFPYIIFFTLENNTIIILRIRHKKQLPLKRFG